MNGMEKTGNDPMRQFQGNAFPSISKQLPSMTNGPYPGFSPASPSLPTTAHRSPPACSLHSRSLSQPAFCYLSPQSYRADSSPTASLSDSISVDDHDASVSRSPPLPSKDPAGVAPARDGLPPRCGCRFPLRGVRDLCQAAAGRNQGGEPMGPWIGRRWRHG
ncbi:Basic region leucine zipper [Musa troglodytarum]|uniref:Basic region leucine zipper n=1 Tax=Musa troglodytarum TaxID=320322 RepID=A0A9E7FS49_9LILI|nr:Basic region leucine zipper [Musa troglodytarum]